MGPDIATEPLEPPPPPPKPLTGEEASELAKRRRYRTGARRGRDTLVIGPSPAGLYTPDASEGLRE
jgi:hypothetical protein